MRLFLLLTMLTIATTSNAIERFERRDPAIKREAIEILRNRKWCWSDRDIRAAVESMFILGDGPYRSGRQLADDAQINLWCR